MRILLLYRPRLPSLRAQAIQVVHACHALAERGHTVTLLADRGGEETPDQALRSFGLAPIPTFDLRIAPSPHPVLAGLWFRAGVLSWWSGAPGVVLARDKRRLLPFTQLGRRHRLVLETHEVDSLLAQEAGRPHEPVHALEARVLRSVDALYANCGGTLALWRQVHGSALPARTGVVHNATSGTRLRSTFEPDGVVRVVGSLGTYKGPEPWVAVAPSLPAPLELVGATEPDRLRWRDVVNLRLVPPLAYEAVPDLLARSAALVLPLQDNLFGRCLTSPLKLWDYLACPTPLVLPDLPTIREITDATATHASWYDPKRPETYAPAVAEALASPPRKPFLRTWAERAEAVEAFLS